MDIPDEYVVFFLKNMECHARVEHFEALRIGMQGGDPCVDYIDVDGAKGIANCQMISNIYLSTPKTRVLWKAFNDKIQNDLKNKEPWED